MSAAALYTKRSVGGINNDNQQNRATEERGAWCWRVGNLGTFALDLLIRSKEGNQLPT
jgi:hypothetical protein